MSTADTKTETPSRRRIGGIAGVRVVAAMLVFVSHASTLFESYGYGDRFVTARGAWMFLVLSGFLFAASAPATVRAVPSYVRKRLVRVWPLYALVFLAMWSAIALNLVSTGTDANLWNLVSNLTLTQCWSLNETWSQSVNPPSWSMSVEFFAWCAIPFVFLFQRKRIPVPSYRQSVALFIGTLGVVVLLGPAPLPVAVRDAAFVLVGVQLRYLFDAGFATRRPGLIGLVSTALVLSGGWAFTNTEGAPLLFMWARLASALGFAGVIVAITNARSTGFLQSRLASSLGSWSFAFFLLQSAALSIFGRLLLSSHPPAVVAVAACAGCAAVTWAASAVCHRYVEQPLGNLFSRGAATSRA